MLLNGGYNEQFQRVKRYLEKVKNQDRGIAEYSDDVWAFFQNCWHLKDWIKNDQNLQKKVRDNIEAEVKNYDSLMICAELTIRSKHLLHQEKISRQKGEIKRNDAKLTRIDTTYHASPAITDGIELPALPQEKGYVEYTFYIETSDGNKMNGLSIAIKAVEDWEKILSKYGLK